MQIPEWLPDLIPVEPWSTGTFNKLYEIFSKDFIESQPVYQDLSVWYFPEEENGKKLLFWHLTHRDNEETGERLPDLARSTRLSWIRPIIEHPTDPEILAWDYLEADKSTKTYLWMKDFDFVVIMKKYVDGSRRLITSFYLDYSNTRRKMSRKYEKRIK